ncbi:MAG: hypothetical protein JSV88_26175, partial [Candidatus Aminicenantes bacterium]
GETLHQSLYFETYLCAHDVHAEIIETKKGKIRVGIRCYGVLKKPWKYIKTEFFPLFEAPDAVINKEIQKQVEKYELFNLVKDPGELQSVARTPAGNRMQQNLNHLLAAYTGSDKPGQKNQMKLTKEQLQKLKSLGYIE